MIVPAVHLNTGLPSNYEQTLRTQDLMRYIRNRIRNVESVHTKRALRRMYANLVARRWQETEAAAIEACAVAALMPLGF